MKFLLEQHFVSPSNVRFSTHPVRQMRLLPVCSHNIQRRTPDEMKQQGEMENLVESTIPFEDCPKGRSCTMCGTDSDCDDGRPHEPRNELSFNFREVRYVLEGKFSRGEKLYRHEGNKDVRIEIREKVAARSKTKAAIDRSNEIRVFEEAFARNKQLRKLAEESSKSAKKQKAYRQGSRKSSRNVG